MDNLLKPQRFDAHPDSNTAEKEWTHWIRIFENYIEDAKVEKDKKLKILINFLSFANYEYITDCVTYEAAKETLQKTFVKHKSEVFARYLLASRKQQESESIDQYALALRLLSKDCNFAKVSADSNCDDSIRDSFINGILSSEIRQRLLENDTLTLKEALQKARSMESGQKQAQYYVSKTDNINALTTQEHNNGFKFKKSDWFQCWFCGSSKRHTKDKCPATNSVCSACGKLGHYACMCQSKRNRQQFKRNKEQFKRSVSAITNNDSLSDSEEVAVISSLVAASPGSLSKAVVNVTLGDNITASCLTDTGSSSSYIREEFLKKHSLLIKKFPYRNTVSMAATSLSAEIKGYIETNLIVNGHNYEQLKLSVLPSLCSDVLLGHDVLREHSRVDLEFGGDRSPLSISAVTVANVEPARLFTNLLPDIKPIAMKSRRHSIQDSKFIDSEIQRLLSEGVIEESTSPWRAQVLVVKNENHKKRMVVDYSGTINRYTLLDAYPIPNINNMITEISQYSYFSTLDLKSAYHQVPIPDEDKPYTAFEAGGALYQFKVIAFGLTNGVSGFQRFIDKIIRKENLTGVFAYIDDVTICGKTKEEHDSNLAKFLAAVKKYGLTLNEDKCRYSVNTISILGHLILNHTIRPDPERMKSLIEFPAPRDTKSLKRFLGMLSHYSKWIRGFSEKIRPLVDCKVFPMSQETLKCFIGLKKDITDSVIISPVEGIPLVVETDASDHAIAATLSQEGKPVAFFSRTLNISEKKHPAIEKEACAIVESLKKWKHFLTGRNFTVITDQEALSFIFNMKHSSKIKNDKIMRWRLELSGYNFDIVYRPGQQNVVADTLSRLCGAMGNDKLFDLHHALCHPGITRMFHYIRCRNLPYSLEDVKKVINSCPICAEVKPRFYKRPPGTLIKATQPFERISIDFKGPLPTNLGKPYLLTVVDEYSRFPFGFPCKDMSSSTVIKCFIELFTIFGMPAYVHSDRGASFLSQEVKTFLHSRGTATSHSTPYHPQGNGQVEKFNDTVWKAVTLAIRSRKLKLSQWEAVLPDALHSIRSLLCTSTNCTPHERMFKHNRRSATGSALPVWLIEPGPVYLKRFDRSSKNEPLVEEVELVESNPNYAVVRHSSGRESTVALQHLAPRGDVNLVDRSNGPTTNTFESEESLNPSTSPTASRLSGEGSSLYLPDNPSPRREDSTDILSQRPVRERRLPTYLNDYVTSKN